jgi:hypothetical protein
VKVTDVPDELEDIDEPELELADTSIVEVLVAAVSVVALVDEAEVEETLLDPVVVV